MKAERTHAAWWKGALLLLVAWALSVGPAARCMERGDVDEQTLAVVYAPIVWCETICPPVYRLFDEYAAWWQ